MVNSINKDLAEQARKDLAQFLKDHEEPLRLNIEWTLETKEAMESCLRVSACDELTKSISEEIKRNDLSTSL